MDGDGLRGVRERRGMTQNELAKLLNGALDRNYTKDEISRWERGKRPTPKLVGEFLENLEVEELAAWSNSDGAPPEGEPVEFESSSGRGEGDTAPPPPPGQEGRGQLPLTTGDPALARVCEELWEMVATGVGLVGAATRSEALKADGLIIEQDKKALGRAYGKLAESNQTFRRMLLGATTSGAWLEVAMVTGITFGKCARNHQAWSAQRAAERMAAEAEENGQGEFSGDFPGYSAAA